MPVTGLLAASSTALTVRVPDGSITGRVRLTTPANKALSPRPFIIDVTSPEAVIAGQVTVGTAPQGVAFSPDGRKLYVANQGSVSLISTVTNKVLVPNSSLPNTARAVPSGIVASRDGKRVYVDLATGIAALDAALVQTISSESVRGFTIGEGAQASPQALALSPDGTRLYVADNLPGGVVRTVTLASRSVAPATSFGPRDGARRRGGESRWHTRVRRRPQLGARRGGLRRYRRSTLRRDPADDHQPGGRRRADGDRIHARWPHGIRRQSRRANRKRHRHGEQHGASIEPGRTLALVGMSGGGKTTLAHLLPRFFDPTAGAVLLGGVDLRDLRLAEFDVLGGINLLREGLDLPEVSLVAILDADKEGFLRSERSLIQTIGRAARHVSGKVIMYADKMTDSMKRAIDETNRRRAKQVKSTLSMATPISVTKAIHDLTEELTSKAVREGKGQYKAKADLPRNELRQVLHEMEKQMKDAAKNLEFEKAAALRDELYELKSLLADDESLKPWEQIKLVIGEE